MREVYRKPTHTNRYVQFTSHRPESVKSGVIDCLVKRAATVSSNDELLEKEDKIREAMNQNNYPKHFEEKAIEKGMRQRIMPRLVEQELDQGETTAKIPFIDGLSQEVRRTTTPVYSVKDKLPHDLTTNPIYSIKCKTCDEEYVGEFVREFIHLGNTEKSAIAQHVHQQEEPHEIDWSTISVIDRAQAWWEWKLREAFKGAVSRYSVIFCTLFARAKMATARASVADISSVSRANNFTAPAESSKCRFPGVIVVFCGRACLVTAIIFPHTKSLPKITDYRDTAALKSTEAAKNEQRRWIRAPQNLALYFVECSIQNSYRQFM